MTLEAGKKQVIFKLRLENGCTHVWTTPSQVTFSTRLRINSEPERSHLLTFSMSRTTTTSLDQQPHHIIKAVITGEGHYLNWQLCCWSWSTGKLGWFWSNGLCAAGLLDNSFYFYEIPPEYSWLFPSLSLRELKFGLWSLTDNIDLMCTTIDRNHEY